MKPSCVVVGALCEDIVKRSGSVRRGIGGTAYYFSAAFSALGGSVGCVTKTADKRLLSRLRDAGIETDAILPGTTCCFELSYKGGNRSLRLLHHSSKIGSKDIPSKMLRFDGLHLGPVESELDSTICELRKEFDFISLDIQGLTRIFDAEGGVSIGGSLTGDTSKLLRAVDVVKFSEEEANSLLGPESAWDAMAAELEDQGLGTLIVTLGPRGAILYEDGRRTRILPYPAKPVEWTGAGDCFMAGFVFQRLKGFDSVKAANFGSALAAIVIEKPRPLRFPEEKDVLAKMRSGFKP